MTKNHNRHRIEWTFEEFLLHLNWLKICPKRTQKESYEILADIMGRTVGSITYARSVNIDILAQIRGHREAQLGVIERDVEWIKRADELGIIPLKLENSMMKRVLKSANKMKQINH